jgi:hypothetical protein
MKEAASEATSIVPDALTALAFKSVDDLSSGRLHKRSHYLQFFAA